ncbi:MAG: leucyl/phenylalanyl-tRNA--protein transferase [Pseudomonadota bacterium]
MKDTEPDDLELTPELVLRAYGAGVFPMSDSADADAVYWVDPRKRGILPLSGFHLSRSLKKRLLRADYRVRIDTAFTQVLDACADRPETWINAQIRDLFIRLHHMGYAHSVEVWQDGNLAGGLYGLRLGAAFFGESMFSEMRDGSKIALAWLVARMRAGGFTLLDTQFTTQHLETMGARLVPRAHYHELLERALSRRGNFYSLTADTSPADVVQLITQRS